MALEIEILVELKSDIELARSVLGQFDFKGAKKTVDHYYDDPLRDNLKPDARQKLRECCRLREKNGAVFVAYKVDHYDGETWLYSDEHETTCGDLKTMQAIFAQLGLQLLVTVENTKYTYETDLYEIVLEDVTGLGTFLEVEYHGPEQAADPMQIKQDMEAFMRGLPLELGEELNSGKPELLLRKKAAG